MISLPTYAELILENHPEVMFRSSENGSTYEDIISLSDIPIPDKATLDQEVLPSTKARVWRAIQAERDRRSSTGGYKIGTNWFHSDQASRTQQLALVILGANLPAGIMWKTMSGAFVQMTPTLAGQIFQTAVGSDQNIFGRAEQHRVAMMSSATPENYDFSTGWPQTYEESLAV
jgi:hypothetical protein